MQHELTLKQPDAQGACGEFGDLVECQDNEFWSMIATLFVDQDVSH